MLWGIPLGIILAFLAGAALGVKITYEVMRERRSELVSSNTGGDSPRSGSARRLMTTLRSRKKTAEDPAG